MEGESYRALYLREMEGELRAMEDAVLLLERNPWEKARLVDELFRHAHTIKGSSRAMGYHALADVARDIENTLDEIRGARREFDKDFFGAIFPTLDAIGLAIRAVPEGEQPILPGVKERWEAYMRGEHSEPHQKASAPAASNEDARIPFAHLEKMMGVSEDLMQTRMRLEGLGAALFGSMAEGSSPAGAMVKAEYQSMTRQLRRLTTELGRLLEESRMIPLRHVLQGLPRATRDLSAALQKHITLRIEGQDLEVDRAIVEHLGGPLIHLIRNAIDHGIEQEGEITVAASHQGEFISLRIEDDGKGLRYDDVLRVARERGVIRPDQQLAEAEIRELIFHPNISTTETATDISGRGVGLFSVKEYARSVGGSVAVDSPIRDGRGTRFTLTLPASLALARVLILRSGHSFFCIPVSQVADTSVFDALSAEVADGKEILRIEERAIPLLRLHDMLGLNIGTLVHHMPHLIVTVRTDRGDVALLVDQVVREEEVVVKPLPHLLVALKGFSGAATLGDGRMVFMLDPAGLLAIPGIAASAPSAESPLSPYEQDQMREIMNVVASHAGSAIARRLGLQVELSVPEYAEGSFPLAEHDWGASALGIRFGFEGAYPGHVLLEMPETMAQMVGKKVLERDIIIHELSNEDRAFFQEFGMIAMHAVGNMLSRVSKNPVMTGAPDLRIDARGALRTYFLSGHSGSSGDLIRVRLWFAFGDRVDTSARDQAGSITMEFPRKEARALLAAMGGAS